MLTKKIHKINIIFFAFNSFSWFISKRYFHTYNELSKSNNEYHFLPFMHFQIYLMNFQIYPVVFLYHSPFLLFTFFFSFHCNYTAEGEICQWLVCVHLFPSIHTRLPDVVIRGVLPCLAIMCNLIALAVWIRTVRLFPLWNRVSVRYKHLGEQRRCIRWRSCILAYVCGKYLIDSAGGNSGPMIRSAWP